VIGRTLGPYQVLSKLGEGGMGEVYRARDTRLDRTVAIKILPPAVADDPERRARFEREARTVAALSHPHICTLHDLGQYDGASFLVMEHLAGQTLAERLRKGPLPLEQALTVAIEIAEALAAAHRHGIIHRDLKPANVMLTGTGAKLLDFGLAKLKPAVTMAGSVTVSAVAGPDPVTGAGTILGTVPYIAPEQLEGREADARSDLFAFGAVLYEMLTGRRAFAGDSPVSVIAAILERDPPPPSSLQPLTPPLLDRIVRQCLAKTPDDRPDTAHDVANDLRWIREVSDAPLSGIPKGRRGVRVALLIAAGLAAVAAGAGVMSGVRPGIPTPLVTHLSLDVRPAEDLNAGGVPGLIPPPGAGGSRTALAWTPDGRTLVFVGRRGGIQQLYMRPLDSEEARPLKGTEGAQVPAVSPDGQWVAFWADGAIRRVPIPGGPVVDLAPLIMPPVGLVWGDEGLLFGNLSDGHIWQLGVDGAPRPVTTVREGELRHVLPWPLPGGRHLLYTVRKRDWSWGDEEVVVESLATGERRALVTNGSDARYVSSGHLIFLRRGQLFGVPFDAERLVVAGTEMPVLDGMISQALAAGATTNVTGAGQFAIASTGTLAWIPGPLPEYEDMEVVRVDVKGNVMSLDAPRRSYGSNVRIAPDGRRLALVFRTLEEHGVWLYDPSGGQLAPLQRSGEAGGPIWTPDSTRVVSRWLEDGRAALVVQAADGIGRPQVIEAGRLLPFSFTPDGRTLIGVRSGDVVSVTLDGPADATVETLMETPQTEMWPELSPDGRWLAYASNESGRFEVYVRPYPALDAVQQVSIDGGESPAWHPTGSELFFLAPEDSAGKRWMMASTLESTSPLRFGRPRRFFQFDSREVRLRCVVSRCFDVAPSGSAFYAMRSVPQPPPPPVTHVSIVQNWVEQLKAKAPSR
jgi:eukaryotic-like serine/threonine-protein kinase